MPEVNLKQIQPNKLNPRLKFSKAGLDDLASSIQQFGVLRALLTAEEDDGREGPLTLDLRLLGTSGEEWPDEREEPVRGALRRALLAADQ